MLPDLSMILRDGIHTSKKEYIGNKLIVAKKFLDARYIMERWITKLWTTCNYIRIVVWRLAISTFQFKLKSSYTCFNMFIVNMFQIPMIVLIPPHVHGERAMLE